MQKDVMPEFSIPKGEGIFRVMCLGDVVGKAGVAMFRRQCRILRETLEIDFVVANGENAAGGVGVDHESIRSLRAAGVDIVTLGDHVWGKKEVTELFSRYNADELGAIRPANYPPGAPGSGLVILNTERGVRVAVMNALGRTFSPYFLECPFRAFDALLAQIDDTVKIRLVDFHAEATSEKVAMGRYLDGRVSLVFGTHTHVQTADEQILDGGTGYLTDLGMCGVYESVIGMDPDTALKRFLTGMPHSYKGAAGASRISGVVADIDLERGHTRRIERLNIEVRV